MEKRGWGTGSRERDEYCMAQMTQFRYFGYWDVPRYIALSYLGKVLLLTSDFDEVADEYETHYSVYLIPVPDGDAVPELSGDLFHRPDRVYLGQIPIDVVVFDERKRTELDASVLDPLLAKLD